MTAQQPAAGSLVLPGSTVSVSVSSGGVVVPDVVEDVSHPPGELFCLRLVEAPCGNGRGAHTDATGHEGGAGLTRNGVLVRGVIVIVVNCVVSCVVRTRRYGL